MDEPIIVVPYVPRYITVHLGAPDSPAENVTVPFIDYIKNVASSEVYPTWQTAALRANILAQVSFALNRVYTEYYPSRGYDFNITSTTAYDQKFIKGRNIFDSISVLVDEIFDDYIRRQGFVEPLAAQFCNGTTSQCDGLSQWGSEELAKQGYNSLRILRQYYGQDIEIVTNAPIQDLRYSYPGSPLRLGDRSPSVRIAQIMLNRIAQAYPALPKIWPVNGFFAGGTEESVRAFQKIFGLSVDGIIGKGTWYRMVQLYTGLLDLSELVSQGQTFGSLHFDYQALVPGDQWDEGTALLQYLLSVLAEFYLTIPFVTVTGFFDQTTRQAVLAFQQDAGLPQTSYVDEATWNALVERFLSIENTVLQNTAPFLSTVGALEPETIQSSLALRPDQFPGQSLTYGQRD